MERNIGAFTYDSSFSRNNLSSKIRGLVDYHYSVGLHAIGFTQHDKKEIATKIGDEGLRITNNLSVYSTVRFFGQFYSNENELNGYTYDQTDPKEVVIIVAIPEQFSHSSGQTFTGGKFPALTVLEAKKKLNELRNYMNESDRVFRRVPSELLLGCYTFDRREVKYESRTIPRSIPLPDGRVNVVYEIDPYYKATYGSCDFYINPRHYSKLSQEERDAFIEKYFGHKLSNEDEKAITEKPKFYVKRRTFPMINQ